MILTLLSFEWLGQIMLALGLALIIMILMLNLRKRRASQARSSITPREKLERIKQEAGTRNDLRTMMVELEELTRRFSAQLDAKSMKLEKLLDEAERTINRLKKVGIRESVDPADSPHSAERAATAPSSKKQPDHRETATAFVGSADPLAMSVYEKADKGMTTIEIARELEEQVGKVELILALRQH